MRRIILAFFAMTWISSALAGPQGLTYNGTVVYGQGAPPVNGVYSMRFRLYDEATSGVLRWQEVDTTVPISAGDFSAILGDGTPFGNLFHVYVALWIEVAIDLNHDGQFASDEIYLPRQRMGVAAWAIEADTLYGLPASTFASLSHAHSGLYMQVSEALVGLSALAIQGRPVLNQAPWKGNWLQWSGSAWMSLGGPNHPPRAILEVSPPVAYMNGSNPAAVTLSLQKSYDPEGDQLGYGYEAASKVPLNQWRTNSPTSTVLYSQPGEYLAAGWVFEYNNSAHRTVSRARVSVFQWWHARPDTLNDIGRYASLAVVDGCPAIAYYDVTAARLRYVRANDPRGLSWGMPFVLDNSIADRGEWSWLAVVNGRPAIAYLDGANGDLRYIRANDSIGASWASSVAVDTAGSVGHGASMTVVNGCPAIAYQGDGPALKYVRASDADGATWGTPRTPAPGVSIGRMISLAVVNERPAIAFYDSANGDLRYVRGGDANGSAWGTVRTLDTSGTVGQYPSLAVANGRPAVAYYDSTHRDLKYVRSHDANGTAWGVPLTLAGAGEVGHNPSLAVIHDCPAVAYLDSTAGDVKYIVANDPDGASWGEPLTVAHTSGAASRVSLRMVGGYPAFAYYDQNGFDLGYTILRYE